MQNFAHTLRNLPKKELLALILLFIALPVSLLWVGQKQELRGKAAAPASTDTSYNMNVLVIKYFPLTPDRKNIDIKVTGDVGESYEVIKKRTEDVTNALKKSLEDSTKYLGYNNTAAQPALRYNIVDTRENLWEVPIKAQPNKPRYPDYFGVMTAHDICDYVNNKGVREVWMWAYQGPKKSDGRPYLDIYESKMSGPHGDISNSGRENDMPRCNHTYRLYTLNYGRHTAEALESWGHQIEAEMDAINSELYRNQFQGPVYPATTNQTGRCGSVHNPPNARSEYDRNNPTPNKSDCMDWRAEGFGQLFDVSCSLWGCQNVDPINNNSALNYQIWHFQNMPGRNNNKSYQGKQMRNWWDIHGDFDNVMSTNKTLTLPTAPSTPAPTAAPTSTPTPTQLPTSSPSPTSTPTSTPHPTSSPTTSKPGDTDGDGDVDIFDYNLVVEHFGPRMPASGSRADFDRDGDVDIFDYNILIENFGKSS